MLYVGLDHSLTAFGLVAVRPDWELDFRRVRRVTLATKPGLPLVERRALLARDVVTWIRDVAAREDVALADVRVGIEGGMFMRGKAETIRSQERLAGVVEHALWGVGLEVAIAEQRAVRTLFMGRSLSGGRGAGEAAQGLLQKAAPVTRHWHEAELDAFLVANYMLAEAGEAFVSCAPVDGERVVFGGKRRRGRGRRAA